MAAAPFRLLRLDRLHEDFPRLRLLKARGKKGGINAVKLFGVALRIVFLRLFAYRGRNIEGGGNMLHHVHGFTAAAGFVVPLILRGRLFRGVLRLFVAAFSGKGFF